VSDKHRSKRPEENVPVRYTTKGRPNVECKDELSLQPAIGYSFSCHLSVSAAAGLWSFGRLSDSFLCK